MTEIVTENSIATGENDGPLRHRGVRQFEISEIHATKETSNHVI